MNRLSYHTNNETKEWIDDRVNTLIDNNPDMDQNLAYGIAWKQYKKKHPSWEPKTSRLKKNSEFINGATYHDGSMISLYKNPTYLEIKESKEELEMSDSIRGIIEENGTIYCWNGFILHDDINKYFKNINVDNGLRFSYDGFQLQWIFDAHKLYSLDEYINLIIKYKDTLSNFGSINETMDIFFFKEDLEYFTQLNDNIIDYNLEDIECYNTCVTFINGIASIENLEKTLLVKN